MLQAAVYLCVRGAHSQLLSASDSQVRRGLNGLLFLIRNYRETKFAFRFCYVQRLKLARNCVYLNSVIVVRFRFSILVVCLCRSASSLNPLILSHVSCNCFASQMCVLIPRLCGLCVLRSDDGFVANSFTVRCRVANVGDVLVDLLECTLRTVARTKDDRKLWALACLSRLVRVCVVCVVTCCLLWLSPLLAVWLTPRRCKIKWQ